MTPRRLASASILAVGTELTIGTTRDTNSGDLARELAGLGLAIERLVALPDDLAAVTEAVRDGLARVDLVVVTGGLGPTPDDLTREAIAAACDETPAVDPALEAWLSGLFARRGVAMPAINRKQAWLIPSASAIENGRGTAPGLVGRAAGRAPRRRPARATGGDAADVAGPGPATPRGARRGGRSRLGHPAPDRHRRIRPGRPGRGGSPATGEPGDGDLRQGGRGGPAHQRRRPGDVSAADLLAEAEADVAPLLAPYRFASGEETWVDALTTRLAGRRLAVVEIGTGGQVGALLGAAPWFAFGETLAPGSTLAKAHRDLASYATRVREVASVEVGMAVRARERGADTSVSVATDIDGRLASVTHAVFLAGEQGRRRAALAAAAELWRRLGDEAPSG